VFRLSYGSFSPVLARDWPGVCHLDYTCSFHAFSVQIHLHTNIHQHLWKLLVICSITNINAYFLCVYVGVDGIDLALKTVNTRPDPAPPEPDRLSLTRCSFRPNHNRDFMASFMALITMTHQHF
jgi:hypothetical protein